MLVAAFSKGEAGYCHSAYRKLHLSSKRGELRHDVCAAAIDRTTEAAFVFDSSCPGLTRASIFFSKSLSRRGWIAGS